VKKRNEKASKNKNKNILTHRRAMRHRCAVRAFARLCESKTPSRDVKARSTRAWSSKPSEDSPARRAAEQVAARKLNAKSSPLFSWTEVDVSNADRHIPRWQNAVFVVSVVSFFGYYGHKMVSQELDRRAATAAAKDAALKHARAAVRRGVRDVNFAASGANVINAHRESDDDDIDDDDPFDGMTPEEIQTLVANESAPPR
jgi:hypothetical protein